MTPNASSSDVDHRLLLVAQVGEAGRAVVVAEQVEAEGQVPLQREPDDVGEAAGVAVGDRDRQVRGVTLLDQLADRPLDEAEGRLAVGERPLDVVLIADPVERDHHPDALGLAASRIRLARQPDAVAQQRGLQVQARARRRVRWRSRAGCSTSRWLRLASPPAYFSLTAWEPVRHRGRDRRPRRPRARSPRPSCSADLFM